MAPKFVVGSLVPGSAFHAVSASPASLSAATEHAPLPPPTSPAPPAAVVEDVDMLATKLLKASIFDSTPLWAVNSQHTLTDSVAAISARVHSEAGRAIVQSARSREEALALVLHLEHFAGVKRISDKGPQIKPPLGFNWFCQIYILENGRVLGPFPRNHNNGIDNAYSPYWLIFLNQPHNKSVDKMRFDKAGSSTSKTFLWLEAQFEELAAKWLPGRKKIVVIDWIWWPHIWWWWPPTPPPYIPGPSQPTLDDWIIRQYAQIAGYREAPLASEPQPPPDERGGEWKKSKCSDDFLRSIAANTAFDAFKNIATQGTLISAAGAEAQAVLDRFPEFKQLQRLDIDHPSYASLSGESEAALTVQCRYNYTARCGPSLPDKPLRHVVCDPTNDWRPRSNAERLQAETEQQIARQRRQAERQQQEEFDETDRLLKTLRRQQEDEDWKQRGVPCAQADRERNEQNAAWIEQFNKDEQARRQRTAAAKEAKEARRRARSTK